MGAVEANFIRVAGAARNPGVFVIVRAETLPGAEAEFERVTAEFSARVRREEPGCISYVVTREMGSRTRFAIHARFSMWRAFRQDPETKHFNETLPHVTALLARPLSMEIFVEA